MQNNQKTTEDQTTVLLTKREHFAGLAMQAMLADPDAPPSARVAVFAVAAADALMAELARTAANG